MGGRIDHSILGRFEGESWEWQGMQELEFPCTGFSTRNISIVVEEPNDQPSGEQIQALVMLKEMPRSFRKEMAREIFNTYLEKIRPEHLETCAELGASCIFSKEDLPELSNPEQIWSLITGLNYVWVNEDASVNVSFTVTFNPEDCLEVQIRGSRIVRIYME